MPGRALVEHSVVSRRVRTVVVGMDETGGTGKAGFLGGGGSSARAA